MPCPALLSPLVTTDWGEGLQRTIPMGFPPVPVQPHLSSLLTYLPTYLLACLYTSTATPVLPNVAGPSGMNYMKIHGNEI